MNKKTIIAILMAMSLSGAAYAQKANSDEVLAKIGDQVVTQADVDEVMATVQPSQRAYLSTPEGKRELVEHISESKLFYLWGRDNKLTETEKYKETMDQLEKRVLAAMAMEKILSTVKVDDSEVQAFYDEHKAAFVVPESVKASHILIQVSKDAGDSLWKKAQKDLVALRKDILAGKVSFEDAAKNRSDCPSKADGGNLGFFIKGQMVPEFDEVAFSTKVGEISAPVKTQFGYHIVKVTDKKDQSTKSLEEVKEDLRQQLLQKKQREVMEEYIEKLHKQYEVTILLPEKDTVSPDKK